MRFVALLLATLVTVGCGSGSRTQASDPKFVSLFAPPSISELVPASILVNSVPFSLTVNGSNFSTDATVFWNGVAQTTIFVTSKQLLVKVTAADLLFVGVVSVYVRTGGLNSNTVEFSVTPP